MQEFRLRKVTLLETSELVGKLGNTASFGHDGIDALTLKLIFPEILIPLQHLINLSLVQKRFAMT